MNCRVAIPLKIRVLLEAIQNRRLISQKSRQTAPAAILEALEAIQAAILASLVNVTR